MEGLVLTRKDGDSIIFKDSAGKVIGTVTLVRSEFNRAMLQLRFSSDIRIERDDLNGRRGKRVDRYA